MTNFRNAVTFKIQRLLRSDTLRDVNQRCWNSARFKIESNLLKAEGPDDH